MVDGANRMLLLLLGLCLAAAGGLGVAANQGAFDDLRQPSRIYEDVRQELVDEPDLWFAVVIGAAAVVVVLTLLWLIRQFTSRPGGPHLSTEVLAAGRRGRTTLEPAKLAEAIEDDFEEQPAVRDAVVRLLETGQEPRLRARLEIDRDADPEEVLARCETVLTRAAQSLGSESVDAHIRLDFATRVGARVA
ncbi:MAG: hypothetical protein U5K30_16370 [Acidimicrobiales bacterium]|nr:hypothetical protein [Acidimicrobiales bacterium]